MTFNSSKLHLPNVKSKEVIEGGKTYFVYWDLFGNIQIWKHKGLLHRELGPAYISLNYGTYIWMQEGKRHREDWPAYISATGLSWWNKGNLHREDGPATVYKYHKSASGFYLKNSKCEYNHFLNLQKSKIVYIKDRPYLLDGRIIKEKDNFEEIYSREIGKKYFNPFEDE